jgi:hypothetical protein
MFSTHSAGSAAGTSFSSGVNPRSHGLVALFGRNGRPWDGDGAELDHAAVFSRGERKYGCRGDGGSAEPGTDLH